MPRSERLQTIRKNMLEFAANRDTFFILSNQDAIDFAKKYDLLLLVASVCVRTRVFRLSMFRNFEFHFLLGYEVALSLHTIVFVVKYLKTDDWKVRLG